MPNTLANPYYAAPRPSGRLKSLSVPSVLRAEGHEKSLSTLRFKIRLTCKDGDCQTGTLVVQRSYMWGQSTVTSFDRSANRIKLSLFFGGTAVGTLTLLLDSPAGLDADDLYRRDMNLLRHRGHKVCEITDMALNQNVRSKRVLAALFHIAYLYAARIHGCTDLMLESASRHTAFFMKTFGFKLFGREKDCPRAESPAMLLRLPAEHVEARRKESALLTDPASTKEIYPYFFKASAEDELLRKLRQNPDEAGGD